MYRFYSTPTQNQTYSMNVFDISEDEIDWRQIFTEALHGIGQGYGPLEREESPFTKRSLTHYLPY